ncbi:hypothetical protein QFC20_005916 [Naganishia adeliensis]|uniref:Uncharacterized protein n=1 Tax=Naganishia adeliensis TaxID=92952 RepID=A0ACC2VGS0_9TREE|nr:hypothetical protein QFC20_005916 [Naganishia adeliensis]
MYVPSGEAYTQRPVERPRPVTEAIEETTAPVLSYDNKQSTDQITEDLDTKLTFSPPTTTAAQSVPDVDPMGEWHLKEITWPDPRVGGFRRTVKVLTQNANGPCSLLALANVLILRGSIHISSKTDKISYSALSTLIADFLVTRPQLENSRGLTLEAALNILPTTVQGLNVNIGFDAINSFQSTEGSSDEFALFEMAGVQLVHGWIADTSSEEEWEAMKRAAGEKPTYDAVQEAIIKGMDGDGQAAKDAVVLQHFLQSTGTQLTFPGLFALNALDPGSVVAFFRNSHLSVLYRRPPSTTDDNDTSPTLYQLVTDQSFALEPEITWESIVDIDGSGTSYFNSEFFPASSAGGDYSGMSAGEVVRRDERARRDAERKAREEQGDEYRGSLDDQTDLQLARALQEEEDRLVAESYRDQEHQRQRRENVQLDPAVRARAAPVPEESEGRPSKGKKEREGKKDCLVM